MAAEVTKNTFSGGINSDVNPTSIESNQYLSSLNLSIVADNKFGALENIKGTTQLSELLPVTGETVLGVFSNKYKIGLVENVNCLTVFTAKTSGNINILCYDIDNNVVYQMYQITTPADYLTANRIVDGVNYSESGVDILYVTDNYYPVRKIRCEIPVGYTPNFLSDNDIILFKKAAIGNILVDSIVSGGSLLTGTYQVAYQLIDPIKNRYTKFSLLTNPIHVYTTINGLVYAGVGLPSDKKIIINIFPTTEELAEYTHFRLAIVENVLPEGVVNTDVGLGNITPITTYLSGSIITGVPIVSNVQTESIQIDEIVIDLAAIEKVKTLEIKDNRLILANITFTDLAYDNGEPIISSGTIAKASVGADGFSSELDSSTVVGYFREEVYRYAISYFDEFGNYSYPKVLDVSSVVNNQITAGLKDMKFPSRSQSIGGVDYTLMNSSNICQSLGLALNNIVNHPKWSRGFIILRAKRKKNILFQTPVIALAPYYGIGPVGQYPTVRREGATPADVTQDTATPMGPNTVFMPYNMFWGAPSSAGGSVTASGGTGLNTVVIGENSGLTYSSLFSSGVIYPDATMYSTSPYLFKGNEQVKIVDAAITRLYFSRFDSAAYNCGLGINTNCSGTFFASLNNDYYYNAGHGGVKTSIAPAIGSTGITTINGNKSFENLSEGTTLNGKFINTYDKLETGGVNVGVRGYAQKSVAVDFTDTFQVMNSGIGGFTRTFSSGTPVVSPQAFSVLDTTEFLTSATGLFASYANTYPIVNVLSNQSDSRYGDLTDFNEFIFTGTKVVFTSGEIATVVAGTSLPKSVTVWGGDCIVSPHTFKVSDTAYVIINQEKRRVTPAGLADTVLVPRFGKVWRTDTSSGAVITMPVPVKGASQYLTLVMESEYHGGVRDVDTYESVGTYNFPIKGAVTEYKIKSPLTYNYNYNLNKQNDQKIFVPIDVTKQQINTYKSRIYYSDNKIYQTSIEGFDSVRVLNFKDLEERYGPIYDLINTGDNLYGLQESAVSYIPVGERVVEVTDGSQLGVRSGDILGEPLYLDTTRGCQHPKTVKINGKSFYATDVKSNAVYMVSGQELTDITNQGFLTTARNIFTPSIPTEANLVGTYDQLRGEYWISSNFGLPYCFTYNEKFSRWISNYAWSPNFSGGIRIKDNLYVIGNNQDTGNLVVGTMYTGAVSNLFGHIEQPNVTIVINPNPEFGKVFDDMCIVSSNKLDTADMRTISENVQQQALGMPLDVRNRGEGNYKIKTLRDFSTGARLRGIYATTTINWPITDIPPTTLYSVLTKFRTTV